MRRDTVLVAQPWHWDSPAFGWLAFRAFAVVREGQALDAVPS